MPPLAPERVTPEGLRRPLPPEPLRRAALELLPSEPVAPSALPDDGRAARTVLVPGSAERAPGWVTCVLPSLPLSELGREAVDGSAGPVCELAEIVLPRAPSWPAEEPLAPVPLEVPPRFERPARASRRWGGSTPPNRGVTGRPPTLGSTGVTAEPPRPELVETPLP